MTNLSIAIDLSEKPRDTGPVSGALFGNIIMNQFGATEHVAQADDIGLAFFRFPGGTLAERANVIDGRLIQKNQSVTLDMLQGDRLDVAYDLTHPELISPAAIPASGSSRDGETFSFSQVIQLAVERDQELNIIAPVQRYYVGLDFTDPDQRKAALALAESDARLFAERLVRGEFNDGILPKQLLIDIGNEPYENPLEYALVAKVMMRAFDDVLAGSEVNYQLGYQMGNGSNTYRQLDEASYFDKFFKDGTPLIPELAGLYAEDLVNLTFKERILAIDIAMLHILDVDAKHIDYVRHHHLALDVDVLEDRDALFHQRRDIVGYWEQELQAISSNNTVPDYYVSAWTTDSSNADNDPLSLAGAANILEVFQMFVETGVERAAVWGVVAAYKASKNSLPTIVSDKATDITSPQSALLSVMSETLVGATFIDDGGEALVATDELPELQLYAYETEDKFLIFVTPGSFDDQSVSVDLEIGNIDDGTNLSVLNLDMDPESPGGNARLERSSTVVEDGKIAVSFDQEFEIALVEIDKPNSDLPGTLEGQVGIASVDELASVLRPFLKGSLADDIIFGSIGADVIFGMAGNDVIAGGDGRTDLLSIGPFSNTDTAAHRENSDFLFGGGGDDRLLGYDGDDWLDGGADDDTLIGGGGADTFVFSGGHDRIEDFSHEADVVVVDQESLAIALNTATRFQQLAHIDGNDIVLVWSEEHSLRLAGQADDFAAIEAIW